MRTASPIRRIATCMNVAVLCSAALPASSLTQSFASSTSGSSRQDSRPSATNLRAAGTLTGSAASRIRSSGCPSEGSTRTRR
jgi:hypothetical protein